MIVDLHELHITFFYVNMKIYVHLEYVALFKFRNTSVFHWLQIEKKVFETLLRRS